MLTLGIETSCDETAAALVDNGRQVLSSSISSSVHIHSKFGGIVPEIASRFHLEYINAVVKLALKKAGKKKSDLDLIAVTFSPGLVGALFVGLCFAKALSYGLGKPFIGVNHINAHMFAPFLDAQEPEFPFIGLVVSGGHTNLAYVRDFDKIEVIGKTRDDAAGEAFDKVSKMLGLGYPGGAVIDKLASSIEESEFKFSCAKLKDTLDFSFSGIKTAVLYKVSKIKLMTNLINAQIAYSFQKQVTDIITEKSILACEKFQTNRLCVGGGVTCNSSLRYKLKKQAKTKGIKLLLSKPKFCTDNAAMIAMLGYYLHRKGVRSEYQLDAKAVA
ncbi:MAG: tRNA (adenosine(37)-N6)-threonylcarbamoyltransferase complex transferase subunit TsaD [Candidatus Omnitrophota bacterium]|nr:MAG: tRNA (adenosine(37)-N6)-threonylcarbamoyltransferase complex transferase subunit TsaD [Candidatus Omnitrophota bacterium]